MVMQLLILDVKCSEQGLCEYRGICCFGIVLNVWSRDCAGVVQGLCRDPVGIVQGSFRDCAGIVQGLCRDRAGIVHESCRDCAGILQGLCRDCTGLYRD